MATFEAYPELGELVDEIAMPEIKDRAEIALATALAIAPVLTGAYKRSLRLKPLKRAYRLWAGVRHAEFVEFGTSRMKPYRTLLIAARAARARKG